jgi:hypothetical protein
MSYPPSTGYVNMTYSFTYDYFHECDIGSIFLTYYFSILASDQYGNLITNGAANQFNFSLPSYCSTSPSDYGNGTVTVFFLCATTTPGNISISVLTGGVEVGSTFYIRLFQSKLIVAWPI